MTAPLWEIINTDDPVILSEYVDKYLTNDPGNLERIYLELLTYMKNNTKQQSLDTIYPKPIKFSTNNFSQASKKINYFEKNSSKFMIKRSFSMINKLRDKGCRPLAESEQQGINIVQRKIQNLLHPLKTNPVTSFLRSSQSDKILEKYMLNKDFFQKKLTHNHVSENKEQGFDEDMNNFLQRRKKLQSDIFENKLTFKDHKLGKHVNSKYSSVRSKVYQQINNINLENSQTNPYFLRTSIQYPFNKNGLKPQASLKNPLKKPVEHFSKRAYSLEEIKQHRNKLRSIMKTRQKKRSSIKQLKNEHIYKQSDFDLEMNTKFGDSEASNEIQQYSGGQIINAYQRYTPQYLSMVHSKVQTNKYNKYSKQLLKAELKANHYS